MTITTAGDRKAAERTSELTAAQAIVDGAKSAGRDLTTAEVTRVDRHLEAVDAIDAWRKSAEADQERLHRMAALGPAALAGAGPSVFTDEAKAGIIEAVKTRTSYRTELKGDLVATKAAFVSGGVLPTAGLGAYGGVFPTAYPLAALFAMEKAAGPTVRYYVLDAATAAIVAEGGLKPDSGMTITPKDLAILKLATTTRVSDEFVEDAPFLMSHLQTELTNAIIVAENAAILAKFSATAGIVVATGAKADALDVYADAIGVAEGVNGLTPTALITNPADLAQVRKAKGTTGGAYYVDPLAPTPAAVHGVQLVSSAVTVAGVAWLVTSPGVTIYRRGPITAELGMGGDDFMTNQRTMRVEERFAVAVVRPAMLTKITLT